VSSDPRLVRALLACYPAGWRRRYGDEYAQLLCDMRVGSRPGLVIDSLRGALRARGGLVMSSRSPMTVAVWATGLFTVAGIGFQKLSEGFIALNPRSYDFVVVAAAIALLALVAAAAPTALALLRGRDRGAWRYVAVPVIGAAVWYGVLRLMLAISGDHRVHSAPNEIGFLVIALVGIAVVVATAWAASTVLKRLPAAQPARLRSSAIVAMAAGMAATTVAALLWGLEVHTEAPTVFRGDNGILATPFVPSWIVAVVLMAAATVLTANAARRQWTADRADAQPATTARTA
jgi:hypothetical protein